MEGTATCLVAEVREGAPTAATILQGIPISSKASGQLECFQLDSGSFLLRGLSEEMYWELWGATQTNAEGDKRRWRRPLATDGAQTAKQEIATLEVRGVPFGLRSWAHTASLVMRFGSLRSMLNNGLQQGDPNVMCIEVAVSSGSKVPLSVAYGPAPGGKMAYISVIPGSSLTPGQTAGSATPVHVPPPKASTGKATTEVPQPDFMANSSAASGGEWQGDNHSPVAQVPRIQRDRRSPSPAGNPSCKPLTQEDEGTSKSTRPSRSHWFAVVGRAWKMARMQSRVSKQQASKRKTRLCSEKLTRAMQDKTAELSMEHHTDCGVGVGRDLGTFCREWCWPTHYAGTTTS